MSTNVIVVAAILVAVSAVALTRYTPGILVDVLDQMILRLPIRPFLDIAPTRRPVVRVLAMAAAIVCGFGSLLSLSRVTGLWIVLPAAALVLFLAVAFGVAFATMLWPVTLTGGFIALWFGLGLLERAGGESVPFPDDDVRVSALNAMIVLAALVSGYASAIAERARVTAGKVLEGPTRTGGTDTPPPSAADLIRGYRRAGRDRTPAAQMRERKH